MPSSTGPNNSSSIFAQIEQTAGFYPPLVYDLLWRFSSLTTTNDADAGQFLPLTDVQPGATFNTLPFCIGFIPPANPVTGRPINRAGSAYQNTPNPVAFGSAQAANPARLATTGSNKGGQTTVAGVHGLQVPGDPGSNGGPPIVNTFSIQQVGALLSQAYQQKYGSVPDANTLAMLTAQTFRENSGNWPNNNPGMIGNYDTPVHTQGQYSPPNGRSTWGFARGMDSSGNIVASYFNTYTTPQQGAMAFLNQIPQNALQAAAAGDLTTYCNDLYAAKYFTSPSPEAYAAVFPNVASFANTIGDPSALGNVTIPASAIPVTSDVGNPSGWNQKGGSGSAQQAAQQKDSVANTQLQISNLQQQFMSQQQAEVTDLQNRVQQMAQTPPLRLLVNPRSFKNSLEKITADGNWGRNGPIIEHWGEQQDKIEGSGKIAAFFTIDTQAMPDGSVGNDPGLSRMTRNWSASYQNLLSLYLIYRNNGGIWTKDYTSQGTVQGDIFTFRTNLATLGSIYIYYDNIMYVGSFDNFSISESDDTPFSLEYNFSFTVRAWFLLDTQQNPLNTYQAAIAVNGPLSGVQPQPGVVPTNTNPPLGVGSNSSPAAAGGPVAPPLNNVTATNEPNAAGLLTDIGLL